MIRGSLRTPVLLLLLLAAFAAELTEAAGCCFKIGFGAMMKPCCLSTDTNTAKKDCQPDPQIVGGTQGWTDGNCPASADEAKELLDAQQNGSESSDSSMFSFGSSGHVEEYQVARHEKRKTRSFFGL